MSTSMTQPRESRASVQFFDVDLFRNKLETFMRKQADEMAQVTNNKKRKLDDRFSADDKEEDISELTVDSQRDNLVFQFGKRQRTGSYYPLDDDELETEEVSPLALPSPVTAYDTNESTSMPWPDNKGSAETYLSSSAEMSLAMAMRRKLSGYSEASNASTLPDVEDTWTSSCPPPLSLSRASYSSANSMPHTPRNTDEDDDAEEDPETYMTDIEHANNALPSSLLENPQHDLELDLGSMAPHERTLLAALAPERFEKAALIKKAFKQPDQLFGRFVRENQSLSGDDEDMVMDDGEYDQVFEELMHV